MTSLPQGWVHEPSPGIIHGLPLREAAIAKSHYRFINIHYISLTSSFLWTSLLVKLMNEIIITIANMYWLLMAHVHCCALYRAVLGDT